MSPFLRRRRLHRRRHESGRQFPAGSRRAARSAGTHARVELSTRPVFADALRDWRTRRRVSQLELAVRAGTTQRHVSFIESGRSAPGRAMVIRLAESLEVPLRERNELLLGAGFAPAYPQSAPDDPQLAAVRTALDRV